MRRVMLGVAMTAAIGASSSCGNAGGDRSPAELVGDGRDLFQASCAACHGVDLKGTEAGPPMLSVIYAPNHHSDAAFHNAVENGVQPHHWQFGAMPPQPGLTEDDVEAIIAYVRSEQRKAGITEDPSHG